MKYPTIQQVKVADRFALGRWYRFLESPGMSAMGSSQFSKVVDQELEILNEIISRFQQLGGMTPEISKRISWEE